MEKINLVFIQFAFLALPGIIGSRIFRQLRGNPEQKNWEDFIEILLFSLSSYVVYGLILIMVNSFFATTYSISFFQILSTPSNQTPPKITINWIEILIASGAGSILAFIASYFNRFKIINITGRKIKATQRYGEEDVWEFLLNLERVEWAFVRDHKTNLMYFGRIRAWSDSGKNREILMQDVIVHDNGTGKEVYRTDILYFSREPFDLTIELPKYIKK